MPTARKKKKRYTEKDMIRLFGPDYRTPSDEELMAAPRVSLEEILTDLNKRMPLKKSNLKELEIQQMRKELRKIEGQITRLKKQLSR